MIPIETIKFINDQAACQSMNLSLTTKISFNLQTSKFSVKDFFNKFFFNLEQSAMTHKDN